MVIFLCDGISWDNVASTVTKNLATTLGPGTYNNNATVKGICTAGGGKMVATLNGNELGTTFTQIAKQMNTGTFGRLK